MGFRFRKSIPIGKAFRINLSRRGVGWSAGIPETGLSYGSSPRRSSRPEAPGTAGGCGPVSLGLTALMLAFASWAFGARMFAAIAGIAGLALLGLGVLAKAASAPSTPDEIPSISGPGTFEFDIVGEASYQANLSRICGGKGRESARKKVNALLVPEDDNPHDDQAVRVEVDGLTVGYLDRKNARKYRGLISNKGMAGTPLQCDALIVGGWSKGGKDQGHFGVKLDLVQS